MGLLVTVRGIGGVLRDSAALANLNPIREQPRLAAAQALSPDRIAVTVLRRDPPLLNPDKSLNLISSSLLSHCSGCQEAATFVLIMLLLTHVCQCLVRSSPVVQAISSVRFLTRCLTEVHHSDDRQRSAQLSEPGTVGHSQTSSDFTRLSDYGRRQTLLAVQTVSDIQNLR